MLLLVVFVVVVLQKRTDEIEDDEEEMETEVPRRVHAAKAEVEETAATRRVRGFETQKRRCIFVEYFFKKKFKFGK